ncbi:MAG: hypothetical protein JXK07_13360 [Spirochaetes bacterium]|nr:hypothetical protein [Spirochaetota bacterium]
MHKKGIFFVILTILCSNAATQNSPQIVRFDKIRGDYQLNWDCVYELPIFRDIETMISFPQGYTATLVMPGSRDFVGASLIENTVYITRPVDHDVETNVTIHIVTPDGVEEKLIIRCIGSRRGSKVLAVNFKKPNTSELNRVVEGMKARYVEQLSSQLSNQEKILNISIYNKTVSEVRYLFIRSSRKKVRKEYKGAVVYLDGMINSGDNTYIYLISSVKNGPCDIVSLEKIVTKTAKIDPVLISTKQLTNNEFFYCWSIPQIQIPKKSKKLKFFIKIWSKIEKINVVIS